MILFTSPVIWITMSYWVENCLWSFSWLPKTCYRFLNRASRSKNYIACFSFWMSFPKMIDARTGSSRYHDRESTISWPKVTGIRAGNLQYQSREFSVPRPGIYGTSTGSSRYQGPGVHGTKYLEFPVPGPIVPGTRADSSRHQDL